MYFNDLKKAFESEQFLNKKTNYKKLGK
jgi:hypothetical protein